MINKHKHTSNPSLNLFSQIQSRNNENININNNDKFNN